MTDTHSATSSSIDSFLSAVEHSARAAGVFGSIDRESDRLRCRAADSAEEAWYRVLLEDGRWFVELVTANRWLSESIESDLMHDGDPIEELIEEELVELGGAGRPIVQHFRSDDRLYTFRTPVEVVAHGLPDHHLTGRLLLAYEAAFRELGDMGDKGDKGDKGDMGDMGGDGA